MTKLPITATDSACGPTDRQQAILMVDDQAGYRELMAEVLNEYFPQVQCQMAQDGAEAWQLLNAKKTNSLSCPKAWLYPSLIICDLHLPKLSGVELLRYIKQDPDLQAIPVVIFSTSRAEVDILCCYQAQANCFITKPDNVDDFFAVAQQMIRFWLNLVTLPHFQS